MNLIQNIVVGVAHAQDGGAGLQQGASAAAGFANQGTRNFKITDFQFLNILKSQDGSGVFSNLLGTIISLTLTIAAIVAFFYLVVSGFQYITSGGDPAKAQTARQGIINALIGILIIMISYVLLRYVGTSALTGQ